MKNFIEVYCIFASERKNSIKNILERFVLKNIYISTTSIHSFTEILKKETKSQEYMGSVIRTKDGCYFFVRETVEQIKEKLP